MKKEKMKTTGFDSIIQRIIENNVSCETLINKLKKNGSLIEETEINDTSSPEVINLIF